MILLDTSSYSRTKSENDGEVLASTSTLELQKLGVVPRTVFLGPRNGDPPGKALKLSDVLSPRPSGSRRASFSSASPRVPGSEKEVSLLTDGLRRQLAAMGPTPNARATHSQNHSQTESPTLVHTPPPHSTTDSLTETSSIIADKEQKVIPLHSPIISRPESSMSSRTFIRPPQGLGDAQKALPAVASIRENVSGLLEQSVNLRPKAPAITISSGRTSPISNAHTARADQNMLRSRVSLRIYHLYHF